MPGVSCTVGEEIAALRRIAGEKVAARIRRESDPLIERIVGGWPQRLEAKRAIALGFRAETSFDDIVRAHIEDELAGKIAAWTFPPRKRRKGKEPKCNFRLR